MKSNFNGGWDVDQRRRSPINAGDDMKIEIIVGDDEYLVSCIDFFTSYYACNQPRCLSSSLSIPYSSIDPSKTFD